MSSDSNVVVVNFASKRYPEMGELCKDIIKVIQAHKDKVPLAGALGVLDLVKESMIRDAFDGDKD